MFLQLDQRRGAEKKGANFEEFEDPKSKTKTQKLHSDHHYIMHETSQQYFSGFEFQWRILVIMKMNQEIKVWVKIGFVQRLNHLNGVDEKTSYSVWRP